MLTMAAEVEFHGDIGTQQAYGIGAREMVLSRFEANFSAKYQNEHCAGKLAIRSRTEDKLTPNRTYDNDVRQAALTCRDQDWLWSVGRQSVVWGKADGFRVLDIVHPFDYREFILADRESSRLPLAMARVEKTVNEQDTLQILIIPERRQDILPNAGNRFAEIWPQLNWDSTAGTESRSSVLRTPQVGLKWEHTGQQFSYTVNAINRWSPQPTYTIVPPSTAIARDDYRQWVIGSSFDLALSEWVVRGEATYIPTTYLASQQSIMLPIYQNYKQFSWVLGIDRNIAEWLLSAQFFETQILGGTVAPLMGNKQRFISLLVTRAFFQDRLKMRAFVATDIIQKGRWFNFSLVHEPIQNLEISTGWDLLRGSALSIFGKLKEESRLNLSIKYSF